MRSWSTLAGRIFGVEVRIHLSFFVLPLFVWYTEYKAHQGATNGSRDVALVALIFACVAVHELGHALVAWREGIRSKSVILLPIGGIAQYDETLPAPDSLWKREIRIALAGPLTSLLFGLLCAGVIYPIAPTAQLGTWPFVQPANLLRSLVWINIYLAAFNLLPAYPLDGGRVLRALFSRHMDSMQATRLAVSIGQGFATLLILAGMFWNLWFVLLGLFLFLAAQMEERSVVFRTVLETVRLEDIMLTDFATLSPADTLEDALEKAVHSLQDDFPVIRGGDMVGVISRQRILDALRAEGNGYVQAVMNKIFEVAQKKESLASAFRKLTARNLSIIPVVEDQRLVGIVTLQNLMHSMALLAESRKLRQQTSNANSF